VRVKSATDPLELGAALDLVAGVDELLIAITPTASSSSNPSDTSNSTLDLKDDLKEGSLWN
jgi:hypothetical protein